MHQIDVGVVWFIRLVHNTIQFTKLGQRSLVIELYIKYYFDNGLDNINYIR